MERSPEACRFMKEENLSRQERLWGEWCMGVVFMDARGFSRQRNRGKESDGEGFYSFIGPCAPEEPHRCVMGSVQQPLDVRTALILCCLCGWVPHL